ncbi:MAG: TonB-dependent receptor [Opitutae bacterium]|nr:TonB-dependent receptor [Opitutae bacterium]
MRLRFPAGACVSLGALVGVGLLLPASAPAATAAQRSFDISAGDASVTLKLFATQAGEQLLYSPEDIAGVKTPAVRGEFTSMETLALMLKHTKLRARQDEKTRAIAITASPPTAHPAGSRSPQTPSASAKPPPPMKNLTRKNPLAIVGAWIALALAPSHHALAADGTPLAAQSTATITGRVQNVVTGQYLTNARVTLKGTNQVVYTDKFGVYQLAGVPNGTAVLDVFYTDLDPLEITVPVSGSGIIERNIDLTSVARYGTDKNSIVLDVFVVAADRETDAQAIATNEQRFAPNIKNVMSTDSLGDILGGSVGEFMKFLPGLTVENDLADVSGISVRGIGGAMTSITNDGAPASNTWVSTSRTVDVRSMALNDISRIELTKVPTPATPADSLAGTVNMVSKSAFERSGRQFRYSLNLVGNSENLTLSRTPHSHLDRNTYKILPGANIDFTWPITKKFGIVIAGTHAQIFNEQHRTLQTWTNVGTGTNAVNASTRAPFLSALQLLDGPRTLTRNTLSVKADWKVARNSVLSLGHVASRTDTRIGSLTNTWNTGTNGTPTPATGVPLSYSGPSYTIGATGRGSMNTSNTNQLINQITDTTTLTYRYDDGLWRIESGVSRSASETIRRYGDAGFFFEVASTNAAPIRVTFRDITGARPGVVEVYDNNNQPWDYHNLANLRGTTARHADLDNKSDSNNGYLNIRRRLDFLPVPTALQIGASQREQMLDTSAHTEAWTFMGPDGVSGATASLAPYAMQVYKNVDPGYGFTNIPWLSPRVAWQAFQANPLLYQKTEAQRVTDAVTGVENSERIDETVQAAYAQVDSSFFRNRLRVLGGVRFEHTEDRGQGAVNNADAVWQRNPDGSYVRNSAGARVRKVEAGAAGSYQEFLLTRQRRAAFSKKVYQGYYPSLHLSFNVTDNFILRAAYAATYGRPNFSDIIPRTVATAADIDDDDPVPITGRGTLTIRNPTLKPWTADNFDFSAEYYTDNGGVLTAGVFRKNLFNFFGDSARIATPEILNDLGLDQRYLGWNIVTKFNSGSARITGGEINLKQSLRMLGRWGSYFTVFANGTKLQLDGNPGASFTSFIPKSANWGATFSRKRVIFTARWNYRGLDRRAPQAAFGPTGFEYIDARTVLDVNGSYQLTKRLSLVASANNIFNEPMRFLRYGADTPAYARQYAEQEFGIQMAVGLRGSF